MARSEPTGAAGPRWLVLGMLGLLAGLAAPAAAQVSCIWGGTSTVPAPEATLLRSEGDGLRAPGRVAVDRDGRVYVTDPTTGRVVVRDRFGRPLPAFQGLAEPLALAVGWEREIYVGELGHGSVSIFNRAGELLDRLGQGEGEFIQPVDLAVDPDPGLRSIYVADAGTHEIKVYSPAGARIGTIGGPGTDLGLFDFPSAVWVSAAGEIYVGDQSNDRVQVFDRQGTLLRCFGSRSTSFSRRFGRIHGITGDTLGRVYVSDAFQSNVRVFDAEGKLLSTIGALGELPGQMRTPMGLAIDPSNRLLVASVNNGRLEVFGLDDFTDPREPDIPVFFDGFETGDASAWTETSP